MTCAYCAMGWIDPDDEAGRLQHDTTSTAEEILAKTDKYWHLDQDGPMPKDGWWRCYSCGGDKYVIRGRTFGAYPEDSEHRVRARCDVELKCAECAAVQLGHGVALPWDYYETFGSGTIKADGTRRFPE